MGEDIKLIVDGDDRSEASESDSFSSSTSDLTDDASSPSPKSASPERNESELDASGEVFQFSSLMADLPIRRGLSKYYHGKSQSFTCISQVKCVEDLAKKETPYAKRMKSCKSYASGLEKQNFIPGPNNKTIAKKSSRGNSCASLVARRNGSGLLSNGKPPAVPVHRSS